MKRRFPIGPVILAALAACWAVIHVLYAQHREGLFPLPLFAPSARAGNFLEVLRRAVQGPYTWAGSAPWPAMLTALVSAALTTLVGRWIMAMLRIPVFGPMAYVLGFSMGFGALGVVWELLAMGGLLSRGPVFLVWGMVGAAAALWIWKYGKAEPSAHACEEALDTVWYRQPVAVMAWTLTSIITVLTFIHGMAQLESYWDSLILYLGYARMMFEEHGVVRRVVGQVGIGLGANYPHLFEFWAAQNAVLLGHWDDAVAQAIAPIAGLVAALLVAGAVRQTGSSHSTAAIAALAFRCIPSSLIYTQYATPYALGMMYVASLLWFAARWARTGETSSIAGLLLTAAWAAHVNYLLVALTIAALLSIVVGAWERGEPFPTRATWGWGCLAAILAAPWYVRNWIVTGNPVYAFFSGIFGGRHINNEVMASAVIEWRLNGDGLFQVGRTLPQKLAGSWTYFVTGAQAWKTAPVLVGLAVPGLVAAMLLARKAENGKRIWPLGLTIPAAFLFGLLFFYAYAVADYYLYQIVPFTVLAGLFTAALYEAVYYRPARAAVAGAALLAGFSPGIIMGMMGFKLKSGSSLAPSPQVQLTAFRHWFIPAQQFYRMEYGSDMDMMDRLKTLPHNAVLLTHENRHLLMPTNVRVVHLDDWETQAAYGKSAAERLAILDGLGIDWYLYVPNEDRHPVNRNLGMEELISQGAFVEVLRKPASKGSMERDTTSTIPANMNVLYRRNK